MIQRKHLGLLECAVVLNKILLTRAQHYAPRITPITPVVNPCCSYRKLRGHNIRDRNRVETRDSAGMCNPMYVTCALSAELHYSRTGVMSVASGTIDRSRPCAIAEIALARDLCATTSFRRFRFTVVRYNRL